MKKNYLSPVIDTMVLGFSMMQTNDPSANNAVQQGTQQNAFSGGGGGAPQRSARPF